MSSQSNLGNGAWVRPQVPAGGYHCPACKRGLYNRRLKKCGFCGAPIPAELQFKPEEVLALDNEIARLEEERQKREIAAEEEQARADTSVIDIPFSF